MVLETNGNANRFLRLGPPPPLVAHQWSGGGAQSEESVSVPVRL